MTECFLNVSLESQLVIKNFGVASQMFVLPFRLKLTKTIFLMHKYCTKNGNRQHTVMRKLQIYAKKFQNFKQTLKNGTNKKKKKMQKLNCSNFNLGDKMCFFPVTISTVTQAFQISDQCNKFYVQLYDFRITTAVTQKIWLKIV